MIGSMSTTVKHYFGGLKRSLKDPFFKNSFFIMANKGLGVAAGFFFWAIAARLYSVNDVGNAVVLISAASLILAFSSMGFDISLLRYFHHYDKSKAFNTSMVVMVSTALVLGLLYVATAPYISPDIAGLLDWQYILIFLVFVGTGAAGAVATQTFIAMRDAKYTFIQNLLYLTRLPLLFLLAALGFFGIFSANVLSYIVAFIFVAWILQKVVRFDLRVDPEFIKTSFRTSSRNYVASILYNAAYLSVPLIISAQLGEAQAAIYYIAYTLGNFLLQIPISLSTSFFVEGVYGESLKKNFTRAALTVYSILIPGAIFLFLFGPAIMGFFGPRYLEGLELMKLIVLASFPYTIYSLFIPVLNIRMNVNTIILLNAIIFVVLLGGTLLLIPTYGSSAFGYALIATFIIVDIVILMLARRWKWI
ncbi:lipopolysaccharide biosynthesis protein [Methanocella arvoryzae]|uniref:Oligosaccharide repeat unit transporter n=1 Tax=Methanocella arvoryzae (strain DSM 22066 / NBRC 105507 / MRE50) TaxID=351160 RepID=Q0W5Y0_METAR|nr:oligosaccharide flippase family protein [Methanocella arvoryzae]CAJ36213.1 oligosaccharide repeat unit transporter [Methanocella arvoryzae MRE50]